MKNIFYLLIIICFTSAAQVPGYTGKRFSVTANYCIGIPNRKLPANYNSKPNQTNDEHFYVWYDINASRYFNFKANYVITEKKELELSVRNINLGLTQIFIFKSFPSSTFRNVTYRALKLNNTAIGLSVKKTLKGIISPLGKYLLIGLSYNKATITDPNKVYQEVGLTFEPITKGFIDLHLGMGANTLLWDKMILNIALDSYINDYIFTLPRSGEELSLEDNNIDFSEKRIIKGRILSSNLLTISAGIGFLIF